MKKQITFLSLESHGAVAAGQGVTMIARPQCQILKPYKCFIRPEIAREFVIDDIKVGCRSMFQTGQSLDAMQFSIGDGHEMEVEPIMLAQDFIMQVRNIGGGARTFRASWACYLLTPLENTILSDRLRGKSVRDFEYEEALGELGEVKPESLIQRAVFKEGKIYVEFGWDPGYGDD